MKDKNKDKFKDFFDRLNKNLSNLNGVDGLVPLTNSLIDELVDEKAKKHRKNLIYAQNQGAYFNTFTGDLVFPLEVYDF